MEQESNFTIDPQSAAIGKMATLDIMSMNKASLFSPEECSKIMENCIEDLWIDSRVVGDQDLHRSKRQKLRGDIGGFPFDNIRIVTKQANDEIYDFRLLGIIDQDFPQIFRYSQDDYYDWHIDINPMASTRKISFIVNLSDPKTYEGGEIEFLNTDTSSSNINEQGSILIFPSFLPYRIKKVTKGTKNTIIGHIHGAIFR